MLIDMPKMWVHNITNTSDTELTTLVWTYMLVDPTSPHTDPEPVFRARTREAPS